MWPERDEVARKPVTQQDRIDTARRYWTAMRFEMNRAIELEHKAFEEYQRLLTSVEPPQ